MMTLENLRKDLRTRVNPDKAKFLPIFFKSGKGEYGEGDKFLGVIVPESHKVAVVFKDLELKDTIKLLHSEWHEERLVALFILVLQFKKAKPEQRKKIYEIYLQNSRYINNWDLVDSSAERIVGEYLLDKPRDILYKLAKSDLIWDRRIAIIATFRFIHAKEYKDTFKIAELLLNDKEDLIHKAVGWMLRECGKNCGQEILEEFLMKHSKKMPRTALRYAIEHLSPEKKKFFMTK